MQSRYFPFLILLLLIGAVSSPRLSDAATPVVHFSPAPSWILHSKPYDKNIPAREVENGFFFRLLEEQFNVDKQADYRHNIREIVSEAGIQNGSEIGVDFDPSYERVDFHQLIVWRNGKPINRLGSAHFRMLTNENDLSKFIYQGGYSAYLILDDIRKGDRIEYAYTITGRNPIFKGKFFKDLYFAEGQTIAHYYKTVVISASRKLYSKSFNKAPKATETTQNGMKCYEWEAFQVPPVPDSDNTPGWYNPYPYIQVSEYANWKEVTDWAMGINPVPTQLTGELAKRVAELKAESKGDQEKYFRLATTMVQDEVRYMGIEKGEFSHRANTPENVYNQRYGDCKDKARLLASILNADGIEAHLVLVNADITGKIDQFIPSPNVFDHCVVVANLNNKPVWVDATIAYQRGSGSHLFFPSYGKGLVLKAGNTGLTTINPPATGKVICTETFSIPNEKGRIGLEVRTKYTLDQADQIRDKLASDSRAETEKSYFKYYKKNFDGLKAKDSLIVLDDPVKNELTTIERYQIDNFLKRDAETGKYTASVYAGMVNDQLPNIAADVKTPVNLTYPYNLDYTVKIVLPSKWNIQPQHREVKDDAFVFASNYSAKGDTMLLNYQYKTLKSYLTPDKVNDLRDDVSQVSNDELSYGFSFTPDIKSLPFKFNYWMLAGVLTICVMATIAGIKIYRRETPAIMFTEGADFTPLGGWLIVIAISMAVTPVAILSTMIANGNFDLNKWQYALFSSSFNYRAIFLFETLGNTIMICFAVFCFILLIKRRDILPKLITVFFIFSVAFAIADYALSAQLLTADISARAAMTIGRTLLTAAICITYFRRSSRVEQTFIVPYPAHNFSYQTEPETVEV